MAQTKHQPSRDSIEAVRRLRHDDDAERAALEAILVREVRAAEQRMWPYALQWFDNASLLVGNHLSRFRWSQGLGFTHFQFGRDDQSDHDATIARSADNRILQRVERVISMFCKGRPAPRISEGSSQPNEKLAAQTASALLELLFEHPIRLPTLRRRIAMLFCLMGTAVLESEHGESDQPLEVPALRRVEREPENDLFPAAQGEEPAEEWEEDPSGKKEIIMRPEIQARIWTPLHVGPDPNATCDDDAIWFRRSTFEDIDGIWEDYERSEPGYYRAALSGMSATKGTESPLYYWSRINDLVDSPQDVDVAFSARWESGGLAPNHCGKHIFDVRPSRAFPRGRTMVLAGGKLIYCSDTARAWIPPNPQRGYVGRWHEYATARWFEIVGRWLGVPLISLLAPLQRKINAIDACVQENRENIAIGQWLTPNSANIPDGYMSGAPRLQIPYRDIPGHPQPQKVVNVPLPNELLIERVQLDQSIDFIASTGVVDKDIAASAARSNNMLEFMRAERLEGKAPTVQVYEQALETLAQNVLLDVQQAGLEGDPWTLERLRMCAPGRSETGIKAFLESSLLDHHAVRLDIASEILRGPEAKQARAEAAASFLAPVLGQQGRINELLEALDLGDIIRSPETTAQKRAEFLLAYIMEGQTDAAFLMPGIDNVTVIYAAFTEFMQTPRFMELPPEQQQAVLSIWEQCQAEIQKQVAAQQAAMAQQQAAGQKPAA